MFEHWHLHPVMVHFPIALFVAALVLELLGLVLKKEVLEQAAFYNFLGAALASLLAAGTGWLEAEHLHLVSHPVFNKHRLLGFWTAGIALVSSWILWRLKRKKHPLFRKIFPAVLFLTAILVCFGGYHGGMLVYEYGVGIEGH